MEDKEMKVSERKCHDGISRHHCWTCGQMLKSKLHAKHEQKYG